MENATAIFYAEKPIADGRNIEGTVAHETAHQWFGDAVTEADWRHVWLSEGLATYMAVLFYEHVDGIAARRQMMEIARKTVVASDARNRPVVDPDEQDRSLLNPNAYEKASSIPPHAAGSDRQTEQFFDGLRRSLPRSRTWHRADGGPAARHEQASGTRLDAFFDQWIFHAGFPRFRVKTQWHAATRTATYHRRAGPVFGLADLSLSVLRSRLQRVRERSDVSLRSGSAWNACQSRSIRFPAARSWTLTGGR